MKYIFCSYVARRLYHSKSSYTNFAGSWIGADHMMFKGYEYITLQDCITEKLMNK